MKMNGTYDDVLTSGWQKDPDAERDENPWQLGEDEKRAKEEGSIEYASGIVRVSDSPNLIEPNPTEQKTAKSLYERTLGVTKYDELRSRVGLKEGQSFTDYYNGQGYVPEGYEMDAKLLLAEEKRKGLFAEYQSGNMGYSTFLYKAYGKDLLKAEGHDLSSSLYWYNRYRQGEYNNITDNVPYMERVLKDAEDLMHAEDWWNISNSMRMGDLASEFVTGEELSATQVRDLFSDEFKALDEFYESSEEIVKYYRAGYLQGFEPIIWGEREDGSRYAKYYFHTDGKLYAIKDTDAEGNHKATAHYNEDGSLNRITLTGSGFGEISQSFLKGFTGLFTGLIEFGGMLGGGVVDLYEGISGSGWAFDKVAETSASIQQWINQDTFLFGNNEYAVDSGLKTSDGDINWMRIGKGLGSAAGTIAAMLATAGLSKVGTTLGATAGTLSKAAATAGTVAKTKAIASWGLKKGVAGLLKTAGTLTGITNGAPIGVRFATTQSVATIAVKDFLQTVSSLELNKERLGMTDSEIVSETFKMTAVNAAVSMAFRSVLDQAATARWAAFAEKIHKGNEVANRLKANGQFNSKLANAITNWMVKYPRMSVAVNTGFDIFENIFTAYNQASVSQSGEMFNKEAWDSFITNPQVLAFNVWAGISTAKGGFGKNNEGMETDSIHRHLGDLTETDIKIREVFKKQMLNGTPEQAAAWKAVQDKYIADINAGADTFAGLTTAMINLHNGMQTDDMSFVRDIITKQIKSSIQAEKLIQAQIAYEHYNAIVKATKITGEGIFKGKLGAFIHKKREYIKDSYTATLEKLGIKINRSVNTTIRQVSSNLIENYAHLFDQDEKLKAMMEKFQVTGVQDEIVMIDGKYQFKSGGKEWSTLDKTKITENELTALKNAGFTIEDIRDGYFIKLDGFGTDAQGTEEFKTMLAALKTFIDISNAEADEANVPRLIYSLNQENTLAFIPSLKGSTYAATVGLASTGRAVQILYKLRYAKEIEDTVQAIKMFHSLFSNNEELEFKDIKAVDVVGTVSKLYESGYIDEKGALRILKRLDIDHNQEASDPNIKRKLPSELMDNSKFVNYKEGVRIVDEMNEILKKPSDKRTQTEVTSLKRLFGEFNELDQETKTKLIRDEVVNQNTIIALANWVKENPKTALDLIKLLTKKVSSQSSNASTTDYVIRYIARMLGADPEVKIPTPEERIKTLKGRTKSAPIQSLLSSETFEVNGGEVRNIYTATRQDFMDYYKRVEPTLSNANAAQRANITMKLLREYQHEIITQRAKHYGESAESFYRRLHADLGGKLTDIKDIMDDIYNSRNGINLLERLEKDYNVRPLEDRMRKGAEYVSRLKEGTITKGGNGRVYIDVAELVGSKTKQLIARLSQPNIAKSVNDAQTDDAKYKIIFGPDYQQAVAELAYEHMALEQIRIQYPSGTASFNIKNKQDLGNLTRILDILNYDVVELRNNKTSDIPGVYYKSELQEDAALSFSVPKAALNTIIAKLKSEYGYTKDVKTNEQRRILDHTIGMHKIFGGLTYINDDTKINPKQIIYNSTNPRDLDAGSFEILSLISAIDNLNHKQGKLAGQLIKLSLQSMNGVGITVPKDTTLRQYDILLNVIDTLDDYRKDPQKAVVKLALTREEANKFNANSPIWQVSRTNDRIDNKFEYTLEFKAGITDVKSAALAYLKTGEINLNYIIPTYDVDINGQVKNYAMGSLNTSQQTVNYGPFAYVAAKLGNRFTVQELVDTFSTTKFNLSYNIDLSPDEALKYFQNKSVKDILNNHSGLPKEVKDNIYYTMMYNALVAQKKLSDTIYANLMSKPDALMAVVGSYEARTVLGQEFNTLVKKDTEPTDADFEAIALRLKEHMAINPHMYTDPNDAIKFRTERISTSSEYITGIQGKAFYGSNTIPALTGADVKMLFDMIDTHRSALTVTNTFVIPKFEHKLLSILNNANSEAEGKINLFIDSLFSFTPDEQELLLSILKPLLSQKDYDLLESKLKIIKEESDVFRATALPEPEGEKLATGTTFERTATIELRTGAIVTNTMDLAAQENFNRMLDYIEKSFKYNHGKVEYKLSDIESIENKNREYILMQNLAKLLGVEIIPGVTREASILIKNMELNDNMGNFIESTSKLSEALMGMEFNGKRLSQDKATKLALAIYLRSTGMDFQSEWSKYLFVDMSTGDIIDTAQRMTGDKELNDLFRTTSKYFEDLDKDNIVVFDLDKNMMSDSTALAGGRLSYIELNSGNKNALITAFVKNALDQWDNNNYYRLENPDIITDIDKIAYVYAHTPTIKDRKDYVIDGLIKMGVPADVATKFFYSYYDLQSSKKDNNKNMQILFNTYGLMENYTDNQRAKMHRQMKKMNEILKYHITSEAIPPVIHRAMKEKISHQGSTFTRIVNAVLFGDADEAPKLMLSLFNTFKQKHEDLMNRKLGVATALKSSQLSQAQMEQELLNLIAESSELYVLYPTVNNKTQLEIKSKHFENSAKIHGYAKALHETFRHIDRLNDSYNRLSSRGQLDPESPEFKKNFFKQLVKNYIFNSEEAAALSLALTNTDVQALLDFKQNDLPLKITIADGNTVDLTKAIKKTVISFDIENFYNNNRSPIFQIGIHIQRANGTSESKAIYVPVRAGVNELGIAEGSIITDEGMLKQMFPEFFLRYGNEPGIQDAIKNYLAYFEDDKNTGIDVETEINTLLKNETDYISIGFNSKGHDKDLLIDQKILTETSKLFMSNGKDIHVDILNDVMNTIQFGITMSNRRTLQDLLKLNGLTSTGAHGAASDAYDTYRLLKYYIDKAIPLNMTRADALDDIDKLGKLIYGESFKIEDHMDLFDEEMRLETDDMPKYIQDWIASYREGFQDLDNLYRQQEVINRINYMYAQQESEINNKKAQEFINTLPGDTVELIYKMQRKETRDNFRSLISYLGQLVMPSSERKQYRDFTGTKSQLENLLRGDAIKDNDGNIVGYQNNGVLDKVIDILHTVYKDDFTSGRVDIVKVLSQEPEKIIRDISNHYRYKDIVSEEGFNSYKAKNESHFKPIVNVINNELLNSTYYSNLRYEEARKTVINTLSYRMDPVIDKLTKDIDIPEVRDYIQRQMSTFYGKTNDNVLTERAFIYDMESNLRDALINYIRTNPINRITKNQFYGLATGANVGDTIRVNGIPEKIQSDTLYVQAANFRELLGVDYESAKKYYSGDGDALYVPVIRQPNDKPQLHILKVKVADDGQNVNLTLSHDTLRGLFGGDVDGDGIAFLKPTKSMQSFSKDITTITRSVYSVWDRINDKIRANGVYKTKYSTKEDLSRIRDFQNALRVITRKDLDALNSGKANYKQLRQSAILEIQAIASQRNIRLNDDDIEDILKLAWVNQGPNLSFFESTGTTRPYYSYNLESYTKSNIDALQKIKDSRNNLRKAYAILDSGSGSKQKIILPEYESTFNKIANYAPFALADFSMARLEALFSDDTTRSMVKQWIIESVQDELTDSSLKRTSMLTKTQNARVMKLFNNVENVADFIFAMRIYEDAIRNSRKAQHTINKASENYITNLKKETTADPNDQYLKALRALKGFGGDIVKNDQLDQDLSALQLLETVLPYLKNSTYFKDVKSDRDLVPFLLDYFNQQLPQLANKTNIKTNLEKPNEPGFSNFQRRTILYVKDDPTLDSESGMKLGPAGKDLGYAFAKKIQFSYDEVLAVNLNDELKFGMKLSSTQTVPEELDGYKIVRILNDNQIIVAKVYALNEKAKIAIPGTAITKGTFIAGEPLGPNNYPKDLLNRATLVADDRNFDVTKIDSSVIDEFTFKFYDENGTQVKEGQPYKYVEVTAPVAVASHTGTWANKSKMSVIDEVTLGTSGRTLEGMAILGDNFIKYDEASGQIIADSREIAGIEAILKNLSKPDYMSTNAAPVYKMLILSKLAKFDPTIKDKADYIKNVISNKMFGGIWGTSEINKLLKRIPLDEFLKTLNPMEKILFSDTMLSTVFKYSPLKLPDVSELPVQSSKTNHYRVLQALQNATFEGITKPGGEMNELLITDYEGNMHLDLTDSFISTLDFYNTMIREYNRTATEKIEYLSAKSVQQATRLGILNEGRAISGNQSNNFNPTSPEYSVDLGKNYNPALGVNPKVGLTQTMIRHIENGIYNIKNIAPGKDFNSKLDLTPQENRYRKAKESNTTVYKAGTDQETTGPESVYRDRYTILLSALLSDNKDAVETASKLHPDYTHMNFSPNRIQMGYDPETKQYSVKAQPVQFSDSERGQIPIWKFREIMREAFSSREYFNQAGSRQASIKERLASISNDVAFNRPPDADPTPFEGDIKGKPTESEAYKRYNNMHIQEDIEDARFNTTVKASVDGKEEALHKTYKEDKLGLSSSGIKIEDEQDIKADMIAKFIKAEKDAIARDLLKDYHDIYILSRQYDVLDETNEYAFLKGSLNRLSKIGELMRCEKDPQQLEKLNGIKDAIIKELGITTEEAQAKVTKFESIYPDLTSSIGDLNIKLGGIAKHYAKITDEPSPDAFYLITPNIRKSAQSSKERRAFVASMFLDSKADVMPTAEDPRTIPVFDGYHYFDGMFSMIDKISRQAAIHNAGQRWIEDGYMNNSKITKVVEQYFNQYRKTFETLGKDNKYTSDDTDNFRLFISGIAETLEYYDLDFRNVEKELSSYMLTIGEAYLKVFDALQAKITESNLPRHKALELLKTAESVESKRQALDLIKLYDFSNDVIAILSMREAKEAAYKKTSDATFLGGLFQKLSNDNPDMVLVDTFGRILDPDINNFRALSEGSLEFVNTIIKYYSKFNGGFETNVAFDAMNGDVFYMPKSLAEIINKEFYVTKIPNKAKAILMKAQQRAVQLLMSNPFKFIDRMLKYSGFDLAQLSLANPGTGAKIGKAKTDLSAFLSSKGAVMSADLNEYLYARGFDPNNMNLNQILNGAEDYEKTGGVFQGYFNGMNKAFSYQTEFVRYAFWLSTKEKLAKGSKTVYGSAYHQRKIIDALGELKDIDGNVRVSKEGQQAIYIMGQNIGAPGDFPILAKKLNGFAAFTTFPLALVRWGIGETKSMYSAITNMFVEGETGNSLRYLGVQGMGILGIYMASQIIYELLGEIFDVPEEEKEKWEKEQALVNPFSTLLQGAPVMDTFSSINPFYELGEMTSNPFTQNEDKNFGDKLWGFALKNVIGRVNPALRTAGEIISGYDIIDDNLIKASDQYNGFENIFRKAGGYIMGMTGSNAMAKYLKSYEDHEAPVIERIGTGLQRAVSAELGNTKTYKSSLRNYYKANSLIQAYRYADKEVNPNSNSNFDFDEYSSVKKEISTAMNSKLKHSEIYAIIEDALDKGVGIQEIISAVRNSSLRYKISTIEDVDQFFASLTHSEKETIKTAIAYEDFLFPWLDTLDDQLTNTYNVKPSSSYRPRVYMNNYVPNFNSAYRNYMRTNPYYRPYKPWEPDLIEETPLEAFKGKKEWKDWGND